MYSRNYYILKQELQNCTIQQIHKIFDYYKVHNLDNLYKKIFFTQQTGTMPNVNVIQQLFDFLIETGRLEKDEIKETLGYQFLIKKPEFFVNPFLQTDITKLLEIKQKIPIIFEEHMSVQEIANKTGYTPFYINTLRQNMKTTPNIIEKTIQQVKQQMKKVMTEQYKIHLQPTNDTLIKTIDTIYKLIETDKNYPVRAFKVIVHPPNVIYTDQDENAFPIIVIYPFMGYAKKVLNDILKVTRAEWGSGVKPRGNIKVNNLVYYSGGDWDTKNQDAYKHLFTNDLTLYKNQEKLY